MTSSAPLASVPSVTKMTNDEFRAFGMKALEKAIIRNTPAAKARRAFLQSQRESRKELARTKRTLAAKHAAQSRAIRQRYADAELALRKREAEREAEMAERRWNLIIGSR